MLFYGIAGISRLVVDDAQFALGIAPSGAQNLSDALAAHLLVDADPVARTRIRLVRDQLPCCSRSTIFCGAYIRHAQCPLLARCCSPPCLIAPHLTVYDLVILAPALLLLSDWLISMPTNAIKGQIGTALYCVYLFPLLGPTARWTHVQLSVIAMSAVLFLLWRQSGFSSLLNPQTRSARTPIWSGAGFGLLRFSPLSPSRVTRAIKIR